MPRWKKESNFGIFGIWRKTLMLPLILGDNKSTHLLRNMKQLTNRKLQDDFLNTMWLQRSPAQMEIISVYFSKQPEWAGRNELYFKISQKSENCVNYSEYSVFETNDRSFWRCTDLSLRSNNFVILLNMCEKFIKILNFKKKTNLNILHEFVQIHGRPDFVAIHKWNQRNSIRIHVFNDGSFRNCGF